MKRLPAAGLRALGAFVVLALAAAPLTARAQMESREAIALQNQMLELRHELQVLQNQVAAGGGENRGDRYPPAPQAGARPNDLLAQLLDRVSALADQVRVLTGRVDEMTNRVQRQGDQLNKQVGDLEFRLRTGAGGGAASAAGAARPEQSIPAPARSAPASPSPVSPGMSPPPAALGALPLLPPPYPDETPPPAYPRESEAPDQGALPLPLLPPPGRAETPAYPAAPPSSARGALSLLPPATRTGTMPRAQPGRTPELALREGETALTRRDYAAAEANAREVLASNRASRAADAQFLLGEALAGQRNYQQAALAYDDAYNRSRTGPHAQEALLGMANALVNLGAKPAACATLYKLHGEFLTERAAVREAAAALRQRAACR